MNGVLWSSMFDLTSVQFTPFCLTSVSLQPHCQLWLLPTTLLGRQQRNFRVSLREWKIDANPVDSKSMNPRWLYLVNCNHLAQEIFTNWTNPQRKSWNTDLSDLAVEWGWLMGTDGALETCKKKKLQQSLATSSETKIMKEKKNCSLFRQNIGNYLSLVKCEGLVRWQTTN